MNVRQFIGRIQVQMRGNHHVVGWSMTPSEAIEFFEDQHKTVITFFGFMIGYQDEAAMLRIVRAELSKYSPKNTLVNDGATRWGLGAMYPLAKSLGFTTAGIVSTQILNNPSDISPSVDHICFIDDELWGGRVPNSGQLSPTSKAMVACSDVLIAIGGGDITRDELLAAKRKGKPVYYYPAEMDHKVAMQQARRKGLPPPRSFMGTVHDVFGK